VDLALSMAKELVMREDVDVIVGTINSGAAMAVSEAIAKKEKVPFITWISKSERITGEKGHRYVFSCGENTAMAGKAGVLRSLRNRMSSTGLREMIMSMATPLPTPHGET